MAKCAFIEIMYKVYTNVFFSSPVYLPVSMLAIELQYLGVTVC
jgi:hypothetical protein